MSQPEYVFRRAIQTYAGHFNKQHGSIELSSQRGMKALECRIKIYDIVCESYKDYPEANAKLRKVMDWWLNAATHWYNVLILKSQKKQSSEQSEELKSHVACFLGEWIGNRVYPWSKNPIYWKLHSLVCCLIPFAQETGMTGRISTEGFENNHFRIASIKRMLSPIVSTEIRVQKTSDRLLSRFFPGTGQTWSCLLKHSTANKARGSYNVQRTIAAHDNINKFAVPDNSECSVDGYFSLDVGILSKKYAVLYNFLVIQKVPDFWIKDTFVNNETLGSEVKLKSEFLDI